MDDETRKKMNVEETFAAIDKIIGRLEKGRYEARKELQ